MDAAGSKFMRALSDKTLAIVKDLHKPGLFLSFNKSNRKRNLLAQLGASGECAASHYVLPFLLSAETRLCAATALSRLVEGATAQQLWEFSDLLRGIVDPRISKNREWADMDSAEVAQLNQPHPDFVWALGAASVHGNGYVREAAVHCLAQRHEPAAIAFLIARANDWVFEVRARAKTALLEKVQQMPSDFGAFLPLLERLAICNREDHQVFVDDAKIALLQEAGLLGLRDAVKSSDRFVRRMAYQLALSSKDASVREFATLGLTDGDIVVRTAAAQRVISSADLDDLSFALRMNRAASVRRLALEKAASSLPRDTTFLNEFILDRNSGNRDYARYVLRELGTAHFASAYRDALENESLTEIAILGLGEVGSTQDLEHVSAFLSSPKSRYRRAAVLAFAKLSGTKDIEPLILALADRISSVSKAACMSLLKRPSYVPDEQLWIIFNLSDKDHVKKNIIRLFATLSKWSALANLLRAVAYSRGEVQESAIKWIDRLLDRANRVFTSPTAQEAELIEKALAAAKLTNGFPLSWLRRSWVP